jgi:hypothetical protein
MLKGVPPALTSGSERLLTSGSGDRTNPANSGGSDEHAAAVSPVTITMAINRFTTLLQY